jgi:hypothetical protein
MKIYPTKILFYLIQSIVTFKVKFQLKGQGLFSVEVCQNFK